MSYNLINVTTHVDENAPNARHQSHIYENSAAAAANDDNYDSLNTQTLGEQPQYATIQLLEHQTQRQNARHGDHTFTTKMLLLLLNTVTQNDK